MIYYLDNGDKFLFYYTNHEVIFIPFCSVTGKIVKTSLTWEHSVFPTTKVHCKGIERYLKSETDGNSVIGKQLLEQMLKIKIHGEIIGHGESEQGDPR